MEQIYVRVKDACKYLCCGRTTLFMSDIPYTKMNSLRLYKIKDLEAYLEARRVTGKKKGVRA